VREVWPWPPGLEPAPEAESEREEPGEPAPAEASESGPEESEEPASVEASESELGESASVEASESEPAEFELETQEPIMRSKSKRK
jgi:hypothetical protein